MLNVRQFATIVITNEAIEMAIPGNAGPKFTWETSFLGIALCQTRVQWMMAGRNTKILEKPDNKALIERIAKDTAEKFKLITGKP